MQGDSLRLYPPTYTAQAAECLEAYAAGFCIALLQKLSFHIYSELELPRAYPPFPYLHDGITVQLVMSFRIIFFFFISRPRLFRVSLTPAALNSKHTTLWVGLDSLVDYDRMLTAQTELG